MTKSRVGYKPREIGFNPISGGHLSGDRAGHSCGPCQNITQEGDQLAIHRLGIYGTAVTTYSAVAPITWTLDKLVPYGRIRIRFIQWQLRFHCSQLREKSSKVVPIDLQSRMAIPWCTNRDNLRMGVPITTMGVEYYLYMDSNTQGLGSHMQELTVSGIWSQDQSQHHIDIWLGIQALSQRVENAKVALMSNNMSAVAYPKSFQINDLCLWAEKRGITLVPRHLPRHLNVLADRLSQRGQIPRT